MIDKSCIIIDDEDQDEIVENLQVDANRLGIRLSCFQLNPQGEAYYKNIGDENQPDYVIDLDKVSTALMTPQYRRLRVDVIACDYDLGDDEVNGYELIRKLRGHLNYRREIILYSGNLNRVIAGILREEDPRERFAQIRSLARANIREFNDKNDYRQSIITAISEDTFSLESELESLLDKYGEWTFRSVFPPFSNLKLHNVLVEIESGSAKGKAFQKALLENAIAHMIELNREINE
jgi:hypothetical protein